MHSYIEGRKGHPAKQAEDLLSCDEIQLNLDQFKQLSQLLKDYSKKTSKKSELIDQIQLIKRRLEHLLVLENILTIYCEKLKAIKGMKENQVHYYSCLMMLTGIGENCTKLIAYRNGKFHESIQAILNKHNDLLATLSGFATKFTHIYTELPDLNRTRSICEKVVNDKNKFELLAKEISDLIPPPAPTRMALPHGSEPPVQKPAPPKKSKNEDSDETPKEKKVKIASREVSTVSLLAVSDSPIHSKSGKMKKSPESKEHAEEVKLTEELVESEFEEDNSLGKEKKEDSSKKRRHPK